MTFPDPHDRADIEHDRETAEMFSEKQDVRRQCEIDDWLEENRGRAGEVL